MLFFLLVELFRLPCGMALMTIICGIVSNYSHHGASMVTTIMDIKGGAAIVVIIVFMSD